MSILAVSFNCQGVFPDERVCYNHLCSGSVTDADEGVDEMTLLSGLHTDRCTFTTVMHDRGNILETDGLFVSYETSRGLLGALDGISLDIPQKSIVGIVGESGCGKTTLAKAVMRLLGEAHGFIGKGEIRFNRGDGTAYDIARAPEKTLEGIRGRHIAMIFQDSLSAFNPVYRIGEQIDRAVSLHVTGLGRNEIRKKTVSLLRRAGVSDAFRLCDLYPHELSGGERQRAMTASALAGDPELIIADEPTSSLDSVLRAGITDLIKSLRDKDGRSVMLISHDLHVIEEASDCVAVMYCGRIVEKGPRDAVFSHPLHPYTEGLLESRITRKLRGKQLHTILGSLPDPMKLPSGCHFRLRCPYVLAQCSVSYPECRVAGHDHAVSCWRYHELEKRNG